VIWAIIIFILVISVVPLIVTDALKVYEQRGGGGNETEEAEDGLFWRMQDGIAESKFGVWMGDFVRNSKFLKYLAGAEIDAAILIYAKVIILLLVVALLYAGMGFVNFPPNALFRGIIAVVLGFLSTMFIGRTEIVSMVRSTTVAGAALFLFIVIFVLALFTLIVASRMSTLGVILQKIGWIACTVYLLIWSIFLFVNKLLGNEFFETLNSPSGTVVILFFLIASVAMFYIFVIKKVTKFKKFVKDLIFVVGRILFLSLFCEMFIKNFDVCFAC